MKKNIPILIFIAVILYTAFVCFYYINSRDRHSIHFDKNKNVENVRVLTSYYETAEIVKKDESNHPNTQVENTQGYNYYIELKDLGSGDTYRRIDINDINAVNVAVKEYQEKYRNKKGTVEAEKGFLEFMPFYYAFLGEQSSMITDEANKIIDGQIELPQDENGQPPIIEDYLREKYEQYGIKINHDEGYFFATRSHQYLWNNFAPYLSTEWQELIKFNVKYQGTIISDAHFTIEKDDIKEIISFYENFKTKYPEFSKKHLNIERVIDTFKKGLKNYPCAAY